MSTGSSVYAPSSRPATPLYGQRPRALSSATVKRTKRLAQLRSLYSNAARAFLLRDYNTTAAFLQDADTLEIGDSEAWINSLVKGLEAPELELQRKLEILKITFVATVYNQYDFKRTDALARTAPSIAIALDLSAPILIATLWAQAIGINATISTPDIFPSAEASHLHPSIAIALTLAALKLEEPRAARAVAEAWFGSISDSLDSLIFETATTLDLTSSFSIEDSSISMSTSGLKEKFPPKKALVGSWLRLLDLLTLHVLPKLGEWEAAGDFVRLQSQENGGWVPDERVATSIQQLEALQLDESLMISSRIQRQRDQEKMRLEKDKQREKDRRREKGKGKAKDDTLTGDSPSASQPTSPTKPKRLGTSPNGLPATAASRARGFALLRSTLSNYLKRTTPLTQSTSGELIPFSLSSLPAYLRFYYSTLDPLRLLSVVIFVFALSNWVRTRLASRVEGASGYNIKDSLVLVLSRIGATIQMGTKVTSL